MNVNQRIPEVNETHENGTTKSAMTMQASPAMIFTVLIGR